MHIYYAHCPQFLIFSTNSCKLIIELIVPLMVISHLQYTVKLLALKLLYVTCAKPSLPFSRLNLGQA